MSVQIVVEGDTDLPVARRLAKAAGLLVGAEIDCGGKSRLDRSLRGYNNAAKGSPWMILRDLDEDARCAPKWLAAQRFVPSRWMCLRIAVRETEAWLLADAPGMARFLRVREERIPTDPDALEDPTGALVELARSSPERRIRAMAPQRGTALSYGPLYDSLLIEYGTCVWDLGRACRRSDSLARARKALTSIARNWRAASGRRG